MEHLAKILHEQKSENKQFWKYNFFDLQTGQEDWFYNKEKVNYFPSLPGKLELENLTIDNQQIKLYQSFNQDIFATEEEFQKIEELETSIRLKEELEKDIKQTNNKFARKLKGITPQQLNELHQRKKDYTWKYLAAKVFEVNERTLRRRAKPTKWNFLMNKTWPNILRMLLIIKLINENGHSFCTG